MVHLFLRHCALLQSLPGAHVGCPHFTEWRPGLAPAPVAHLLEAKEPDASAKAKGVPDLTTPEGAATGEEGEDASADVYLRLLYSGASSAERAAPQSPSGAHPGRSPPEEGGGSGGGFRHPLQAGSGGRVKRRKLTEEGLLMDRSEGSNEVEVAESGHRSPAVCCGSAADRTGSKRKALEPLKTAAGQEKPETGATAAGRKAWCGTDKGCAGSVPAPAECSSPSPALKPSSASHKQSKGGSAAAAAAAQGSAPLVVYDRDITSERCDVCYMSEVRVGSRLGSAALLHVKCLSSQVERVPLHLALTQAGYACMQALCLDLTELWAWLLCL